MKSIPISFKKMKDLPIYAASGLIKCQENFYVIADDERSLYEFNLNESSFHEIILQPGDLPLDHKERKKLKPDWESLVYLSEKINSEGILVVPSGSKPNRQTGSFVHLNESIRQPIEIDFSKIYQKLQKNFDELNIEGAAMMASTLILLQRGNGKSGQNAKIDLDLAGVIEDIQTSRCISSDRILNIQTFDLGKIEGSNLSFTDAFALDPHLYFLAVCEETTSTYDDGPFKGALLGQMSTENKILTTWKLDCPFKPEGLWMEKLDDHYKVYLVTDADSREQVSSLFVGEFEYSTK